jgi:hypothetical protein
MKLVKVAIYLYCRGVCEQLSSAAAVQPFQGSSVVPVTKKSKTLIKRLFYGVLSPTTITNSNIEEETRLKIPASPRSLKISIFLVPWF